MKYFIEKTASTVASLLIFTSFQMHEVYSWISTNHVYRPTQFRRTTLAMESIQQAAVPQPKLSPEAQELYDVFEAKKKGNSKYDLVIAQGK